MRFFRLLLVLSQIGSLAARTAPIRRYEANIVPVAIAQDREGVLWLATTGGAVRGVMRFDGLRFETVQAPAGIDLSGVTAIGAAPDGSIWIGTPKGLIRYRGGSFAMVLPGEIKSLRVTRAGRILTSVGEGAIFHTAMHSDPDPIRWSRQGVAAVVGAFHEDLDGKIWFGCGAFICSASEAEFKAVAAGAKSSTLQRIASVTGPGSSGKTVNWADVVKAPDGRIWARNGPDVLIVENGRFMRVAALPVETFGGVRPEFFLDHRGRLWIPNRKLNFVERGKIEELDEALESVTAVFEDRQNTLWFGLAG